MQDENATLNTILGHSSESHSTTTQNLKHNLQAQAWNTRPQHITTTQCYNTAPQHNIATQYLNTVLKHCI